MLKHIIAVAAVFFLSVAPAMAAKKYSDKAKAPLTAEQKFNKLDTNGDGYLDDNELKGKKFKKLDTNKDGRVTLDEFKAKKASKKSKAKKTVM